MSSRSPCIYQGLLALNKVGIMGVCYLVIGLIVLFGTLSIICEVKLKGFEYKYTSKLYSRKIWYLTVFWTILILFVVSLGCWLVQQSNDGIEEKRNDYMTQYHDILYRIEHIEDFSTIDLFADIKNWNEVIHLNEKVKNNWWISVFYDKALSEFSETPEILE